MHDPFSNAAPAAPCTSREREAPYRRKRAFVPRDAGVPDWPPLECDIPDWPPVVAGSADEWGAA